MLKAIARGHRVVVVYATDGAHGDAPDDLCANETVEQRRAAEARAAADLVGTARVEFLGYRDSGMTGWESNQDPRSFLQADVDEAARRLADIIDSEQADILVGYDSHGSYGHPDHIKVHDVTYRAAELAQHTPRVLESTMNRDILRPDGPLGEAMNLDPDQDWLGDDGQPVGTPESEIAWQVDVRDVAEVKKQALRTHASQNDAAMLASLPDDVFNMWLGREHYIEKGMAGPMRRAFPFD